MKTCAGAAFINSVIFRRLAVGSQSQNLVKAEHWVKLPEGNIKCMLCPNECVLEPGADGICRSRGNRDGIHYSLVYGRPAIIALDLIEKAPLYHFYPNINAFSIATSGCNLSCRFCQNFAISQSHPDGVKYYNLSPDAVIEKALKNNIQSINFFYTEPTIYFEYVKEIALRAKKMKLKTVCVTAGYIKEKPLKELIPLMDAFVIGLKGFDNVFYQKYIGCRLEHIKKSIKIVSSVSDTTWLEVVNLLVPGLNDNSRTIQEMCTWFSNEIGTDIPFHFTRFEPNYQLKELPRTPIETLVSAFTTAKNSGMKYVYIGNLPGHDQGNTVCPKCGAVLIERVNFRVIKNRLKKGKCTCGNVIPGRWG